MVSVEQLKQLREETAVSLAECKKALEESNSDYDKAKALLRQWGKDLANKKTGRNMNQGIIDTYVHANKKIGVMLELNTETDFVARSQDFQNLAHEICLQIAAAGEEIPLLEQPWVKDQKKTIKDLVESYIAKLGENISVKKFTRYEL